jgi:hypothetical protein
MNHKQFSKTAFGVVFLGATLVASSTAMAGRPMSSIANSWHNLGSQNEWTVTPSGNPVANHSNDTAEICVFCHTPHGGDNTAAVPIWNRKLNDPTAYTRYSSLGSSTFDATEAPIGSVTIACLSCHDGGQAIDSVINAPGSGGFTDPTSVAYGSMPRLGNFVGGDTDGAGRLAPGVVQNLGTDLSNDHPVSMQYAGGGVTGSAGALNGVSKDPDFTGNKANPAGYQLMAMPAPATAPFDTLFWIERFADSLNDGGRDRTDVILYSRTDVPGSGGVVEPTVECGSCHDPHNVDNPTFLRVSNGIPASLAAEFPNANAVDRASGLCLTCHVK